MAEDKATIDVLLRMQDFATRELKKFGKETGKIGRKSSRDFKKVDDAAAGLSKRLGSTLVAVASVATAFRASRAILTSGMGYVEAASAVEEANSKLEALFQEAEGRPHRLDQETQLIPLV